MLIINDIEINEDTFRDLLDIVKGMKKNLKEGNIGNVKFKLDVLEAHLEYNLLKEKGRCFGYEGTRMYLV